MFIICIEYFHSPETNSCGEDPSWDPRDLQHPSMPPIKTTSDFNFLLENMSVSSEQIYFLTYILRDYFLGLDLWGIGWFWDKVCWLVISMLLAHSRQGMWNWAGNKVNFQPAPFNLNLIYFQPACQTVQLTVAANKSSEAVFISKSVWPHASSPHPAPEADAIFRGSPG